MFSLLSLTSELLISSYLASLLMYSSSSLIKYDSLIKSHHLSNIGVDSHWRMYAIMLSNTDIKRHAISTFTIYIIHFSVFSICIFMSCCVSGVSLIPYYYLTYLLLFLTITIFNSLLTLIPYLYYLIPYYYYLLGVCKMISTCHCETWFSAGYGFGRSVETAKWRSETRDLKSHPRKSAAPYSAWFITSKLPQIRIHFNTDRESAQALTETDLQVFTHISRIDFGAEL